MVHCSSAAPVRAAVVYDIDHGGLPAAHVSQSHDDLLRRQSELLASGRNLAPPFRQNKAPHENIARAQPLGDRGGPTPPPKKMD